jgi:hypothetical protein
LMIQQSTEANWGQMVVVSAVMSGDPEWNEWMKMVSFAFQINYFSNQIVVYFVHSRF